MNPEIETRIVESWDAISAWAQQGGEFLAEQAPLVAWEIVAYGRAYNTSTVAVCVLALVAYAVWVRIAWSIAKRSAEKNHGTPDEDLMVPLCIGTFVLGFATIIPSFCGLASHAEPAIKAWFAPRLYVLEYVADLVGVMA